MIPFLHIGPLMVPTFGLMVAAAMVASYFVLRADIKRRGIDGDPATTAETFIAVPCLVGLAGAKLYHALESAREFFANPIGQFCSRFGLAWFGGLIVGAAAFVRLARHRKIPLLEMLDAGSPGAALGYGIRSDRLSTLWRRRLRHPYISAVGDELSSRPCAPDPARSSHPDL